jgi:archaemetzincin
MYPSVFDKTIQMNPQPITLITYGRFEREFIESIADSVTHEYNFPVNLGESRLDLSGFYDPSRKQYDGNKLLLEVDATSSSESFKTVGLFRVDLFIPILTYIYGQAFFNGRSAIASLFRLKNERYGMPADDLLLLERFRKEVIHELGHTFGLKHCFSLECVMKSSTYVEDIDLKKVSLCNKCREELDIVRQMRD